MVGGSKDRMIRSFLLSRKKFSNWFQNKEWLPTSKQIKWSNYQASYKLSSQLSEKSFGTRLNVEILWRSSSRSKAKLIKYCFALQLLRKSSKTNLVSSKRKAHNISPYWTTVTYSRMRRTSFLIRLLRIWLRLHLIQNFWAASNP